MVVEVVMLVLIGPTLNPTTSQLSRGVSLLNLTESGSFRTGQTISWILGSYFLASCYFSFLIAGWAHLGEV